MPAKSQKEIDAEIARLEEAKTFAPARTMFGDNNHRNIDLQIEYLRGDIDTTADDEWNDYSDSEQSAILDAQGWKEGQIEDAPSSGWEMYRPKKPAKKAAKR